MRDSGWPAHHRGGTWKWLETSRAATTLHWGLFGNSELLHITKETLPYISIQFLIISGSRLNRDSAADASSLTRRTIHLNVNPQIRNTRFANPNSSHQKDHIITIICLSIFGVWANAGRVRGMSRRHFAMVAICNVPKDFRHFDMWNRFELVHNILHRNLIEILPSSWMRHGD
jgi:hypothetical protein